MKDMIPFGVTAGGEEVFRITIRSDKISCQILTFGAAIRSLIVPDRDGNPVDVVLGYDTLEAYASQPGYLGATVGRFANRIAGSRFSLGGRTYTLAANDGANHLHGGLVGFSHRNWHVEHVTAQSVTLLLESPDGEEGYPGNLTVRAQYALDGDTLSIRYWATSDRDTVCNLTNHSYFNLAGHDSGVVLEQSIQMQAQYFTPNDAENIPLGTIEPVADTPMDLRTPTGIGAKIGEPYLQLIQARGYDHNFVVDGPTGTLRPAARAYAPTTGITMEVATTLPGVHLYTANFIEEGRAGKNGACYGPRHAYCLETQFFPDAPNQPAFPPAVLKANEIYDHTTTFQFSVQDGV